MAGEEKLQSTVPEPLIHDDVAEALRAVRKELASLRRKRRRNPDTGKEKIDELRFQRRRLRAQIFLLRRQQES